MLIIKKANISAKGLILKDAQKNILIVLNDKIKWFETFNIIYSLLKKGMVQ